MVYKSTKGYSCTLFYDYGVLNNVFSYWRVSVQINIEGDFFFFLL